MHRPLAVRKAGDAAIVRDRFATRRFDLGNHLVGRPGVTTSAIDITAQIIDHHPGAFRRQRQRLGPAKARPVPVTIATLPFSLSPMFIPLSMYQPRLAVRSAQPSLSGTM